MLYIDIDEFKSVNDTLGHLIGDELLKSVAVSLGRCVDRDDFVARLGGDEFAIVQTGVKNARRRHRTRDAGLRSDPRAVRMSRSQVTTDASIGIALAPQHGTDSTRC